jgi:hypothetical protein
MRARRQDGHAGDTLIRGRAKRSLTHLMPSRLTFDFRRARKQEAVKQASFNLHSTSSNYLTFPSSSVAPDDNFLLSCQFFFVLLKTLDRA